MSRAIRDAKRALGVIAEKVSGESADVRRSNENLRLLIRGTHPATHRRLVYIPGLQCGMCAHHVISPGHAKNYHKCVRHRLGITGGPASDIRVSWPACELFEAKP